MSYRGYGIQGVFALEKLGERDTGFLLRTSFRPWNVYGFLTGNTRDKKRLCFLKEEGFST